MFTIDFGSVGVVVLGFGFLLAKFWRCGVVCCHLWFRLFLGGLWFVVFVVVYGCFSVYWF